MDTELVNFDDKLKMRIFKDDMYIGRSIKAGYGWDRWMIPFLDKMDHSGKVIIDVGANIGGCALLFSYYAPVYAYEPFHIDILSENCNQETMHKITPVGKALSDHVETKKFYYTKLDGRPVNCGVGTFNPDGDLDNWEHVRDFETTTLDLEDIKEPISLIKIDVQGEDIQALHGMKDTLIKNDAAVLIECVHDWEIQKSIEFLQPIGYMYCSKWPECGYLFTKYKLEV